MSFCKSKDKLAAVGNVPCANLSLRMLATAYDFAVHADEGYVEQRFELPACMDDLSDEQKAVTLVHISRVSRRWRQLSNDQALWHQLYLSQGWKYDQKAINTYLSNKSSVSKSKQQQSSIDPSYSLKSQPSDSTDASLFRPMLAPVPLARTTASMYDPAALPTMPGAPSGRLRTLRKPSDIFIRLRQRRNLQQSQQSNTTSPVSPTTSPSSSSSLPERTTAEPEKVETSSSTPPHLRLALAPLAESSTAVPSSSITPTVSPTTSSHNLFHSNVGRRIAALPRTPFPQPLSLAAPSSYSRSQPLVTSTTRESPFAGRSANVPDARGSVSATAARPMLMQSSSPSQKTIDHAVKNRSMTRRHVKYDEILKHHYSEETGRRFINWRRLYRNRSLIAKQWREGKCKMRVFPPTTGSADVLDMHAEGIYCIQFDDDKIVSGSRDRSIKVWDMRTGECRKTLIGHTASVLCLQFDDEYIVSGSSDSTIVQWNIETGRVVKTLLGHSESVLNLRFYKNRIVSCSKDRTVRIWDLETGRQLKTLRGHRAAVNAIQFRGNRVVSASGDRTIKLWDMDTGQCLRTFDSHSRGIACVEFDGDRIVSGSSDQTIKVWDAATGQDIHTLAGHMDLVRTLQLDPASNRIVSGSYDGSLKVWSLDEGRLLFSLSQAIEGRVALRSSLPSSSTAGAFMQLSMVSTLMVLCRRVSDSRCRDVKFESILSASVRTAGSDDWDVK
ncbi:hypothetical protein DFQ28_009805 [Apophysomyces sp. BC1034]|nr:hypothetical protein DFQ28_009805 [Apophysomyces sp. BC1034]